MRAKVHLKAIPCLSRGLSQDAAVQALLLGHIARFGDALVLLTQSPLPSDAIHMARVALRRLRAALQAVGPRVDPHLLAQITRRLRNLFRTLGVARDAEVLATHGGSHGQLQSIAKYERRALRKGLKASGALQLEADLQVLFARKSWRHPAKSARACRKDPVELLATKALDRAWARAIKKGASVTALAPKLRHSLRKRLKSLRYIAEDFAPLWRPEASSAFLAALGDLQDDLGLLNDIYLAKSKGLPHDSTAAQAALTRAEGLWQWLFEQKRWWSKTALLQRQASD